jgi:cytochrome c oxidase accessory protein FixG
MINAPNIPAHEGPSFRDSLTSIDSKGRRIFFYPKKPSGRYYNRRVWLSYALMGLMFAGPLLRVNGHPLMLFNILERKFILFGVAFWPQDFKILFVGFITLVVGIVLFTAVKGRLFCGWICPQTIFMEMLFRRLEYVIDGDRSAQRKLASLPWSNPIKLRKRTLKFVLFFALSSIIAHTFLAYILGSERVWSLVNHPISDNPGVFLSLILFTFIFFGVFWWFREQVCTIVCPYGRLQGVLLDPNTTQVAYDYVRGEPRGKHGRQRTSDLGDCIDCAQCVEVCPTGIDIRNGSQLECVNCTACIDACDAIMDAVKKPRGLVRYDSEQGIGQQKSRLWRPRIILYALLLGILTSSFGYLLVSRTDTETSILRARGQAPQLMPDGQTRNLFMVKSINKTFQDIPVEFQLVSKTGSLDMIGHSLIIPPQGYREGAFFIYFPSESAPLGKTSQSIPITIEVRSGDQILERVHTQFQF